MLPFYLLSILLSIYLGTLDMPLLANKTCFKVKIMLPIYPTNYLSIYLDTLESLPIYYLSYYLSFQVPWACLSLLARNCFQVKIMFSIYHISVSLSIILLYILLSIIYLSIQVPWGYLSLLARTCFKVKIMIPFYLVSIYLSIIYLSIQYLSIQYLSIYFVSYYLSRYHGHASPCQQEPISESS